MPENNRRYEIKGEDGEALIVIILMAISALVDLWDHVWEWDP